MKKRGAVSTVLGILFFVTVTAAAFAGFITLVETNTDFLSVQVGLSNDEVERINEDFVVLPLDNGTGSNFRVDVENNGKTPVEISDLWIINKSSAHCPPCDANIIEIDFRDSFVPPQSTVNILKNTPRSLESGIYDLKVVSSLGNIKTISSFETGSAPLLATLITSPPLVSNAANTTLFLTLKNISSKTLYDVIPNNATISPSSTLEGGGFLQNPPFSIEQLDPNESATFTWNYELRGASGTKVTFTINGTAKSGLNTNRDVTSNNATAIVKMTPEIEEDTSAIEPKLYVIYPSPAGEGRNKNSFNFWGIVLANPTDQPLTVHRVQIAVKSAITGDHKIIMSTDAQGTFGSQHLKHVLPCCLQFDTLAEYEASVAQELQGTATDDYVYQTPISDVTYGPCNCNGVDEIHNHSYRDSNGNIREPPQTGNFGPDGLPDPIGRWTVPENNLLVWTSHPTKAVVIPALGAETFVAKMPTGGIPDSTSLLITANAYTSFGQYANIGHTFFVNGTEGFASIVNVYPTSQDVTNTGGNDEDLVESDNVTFLDRDFIGVVNTTASQTITINATIREGQDAGNNDVSNEKSGMIRGVSYFGLNCNQLDQTPWESYLVIGIPPGFPTPTLPVEDTDFCKGTVTTYSDGSQRIFVAIKANIGNVAEHTERKTFEFQVTTPNVTEKTQYVVTLTIDGRDRWFNPLGATSQAVVLIVRPTS